MITKERFVELLAEDGINQRGAEAAWCGGMERCMEEAATRFTDIESEFFIHRNNQKMLKKGLVPVAFRLSINN